MLKSYSQRFSRHLRPLFRKISGMLKSETLWASMNKLRFRKGADMTSAKSAELCANEVEKLLLEYLEHSDEAVELQKLLTALVSSGNARPDVEAAVRSLYDQGKIDFDSQFEVSSSSAVAA